MRKPLGARGLKAAVDPNHLDHLSNILTNSFQLADAAVSAYSKVDKTGFIGFIATYIEIGIDAGRSLFQTFGIQNAYGPSILLFTIIGKNNLLLSYPLLSLYTSLSPLCFYHSESINIPFTISNIRINNKTTKNSTITTKSYGKICK